LQGKRKGYAQGYKNALFLKSTSGAGSKKEKKRGEVPEKKERGGKPRTFAQPNFFFFLLSFPLFISHSGKKE